MIFLLDSFTLGNILRLSDFIAFNDLKKNYVLNGWLPPETKDIYWKIVSFTFLVK